MTINVVGAAILVLLDLSAAFNTTDHKILLKQLEYAFGLKGTASTGLRLIILIEGSLY